MKVSYNWLQSYFKNPLPSPHELADVLNTHAFEVESVDTLASGDTVIDVDVLPNRSHDCLSHRGVAREVAVLLSLETEEPAFKVDFSNDTLGFGVRVEDEAFCTRFVGARVNGVHVAPSPSWLVERLQSIGQRSINNIVDITNFVMFDVGKPMHAFDADKVKGELVVRTARAHESLTTLDGKDVALDESIHVIADDEGPLAIAGVKGGTRAEVTDKTKNILIESAMFDASHIRKTSRAVGIKTDSSRRFENGMAQSLAMDGFMETVALMSEIARGDGFEIGAFTDVYPVKEEEVSVTCSMEKLQSVLGVDITQEEVVSILKRFGFAYTQEGTSYTVSIPPERLDLRIPEDMIEEIGRVYGYEHIAPRSIAHMGFVPESVKEYKVIEFIKDILVAEGFSEIQTYMFGDEGEVSVLYPAASDKSKVRKDLRGRLETVLVSNARYADLLGVPDVRVFEIGKVVTKDGEKLVLGLGVANVKKDKITEVEKIQNAVAVMGEKLGCSVEAGGAGAVIEIELDSLIEKARDITEEELKYILSHADDTVVYRPVSAYPFVLRDVAVWVPEAVSEEDVASVIETMGSDLCVRHSLFDVYKKDGRTSYAFNLVFQASDRTLTDEEVNNIMERIHETFVQKGWEVR